MLRSETAIDISADFSRHAEWDQTDERWEVRKPGSDDGSSATYVTHDRSYLGKPVSSVRMVRELVPNRRIAWRERPWISAGMYTEQRFDFVADDADGTRLTQTFHVHVPRLLWWVIVKLARMSETEVARLAGEIHDGDEREMLLSVKKAVEERAGRAADVVA